MANFVTSRLHFIGCDFAHVVEKLEELDSTKFDDMEQFYKFQGQWHMLYNCSNCHTDMNEIEFTTARPADELVVWISKALPDVLIEHRHFCETLDGWVGYNLYLNGDVLVQFRPLDGSAEAMWLSFAISNQLPKDCGYEYTDGKLKFVGYDE